MAEMITAIVLLTGSTEVPDAQRAFESLGFQTEAVVGGSLLITAETDVFQKTFSAEILHGDAGFFVREKDMLSRAVPTANMPPDLQPMIQAIEFEAPPDFGPSEF